MFGSHGKEKSKKKSHTVVQPVKVIWCFVNCNWSKTWFLFKKKSKTFTQKAVSLAVHDWIGNESHVIHLIIHEFRQNKEASRPAFLEMSLIHCRVIKSFLSANASFTRKHIQEYKNIADHRNNFFLFKLIHQKIFQETILERWLLNSIAKYLPKGLKMKPSWMFGCTVKLCISENNLSWPQKW